MGFTISRRWRIILQVVVQRVSIAASPSGCPRGRWLWTTRWLLCWRWHHAHVPLILLVLHSPVLKPYLYLPLCKVQQIRHIHAPRAAEVITKLEFLFQLQELGACIGSTSALWAGGIWPALLHRIVLLCGMTRHITLSNKTIVILHGKITHPHFKLNAFYMISICENVHRRILVVGSLKKVVPPWSGSSSCSVNDVGHSYLTLQRPGDICLLSGNWGHFRNDIGCCYRRCIFACLWSRVFIFFNCHNRCNCHWETNSLSRRRIPSTISSSGELCDERRKYEWGKNEHWCRYVFKMLCSVGLYCHDVSGHYRQYGVSGGTHTYISNFHSHYKPFINCYCIVMMWMGAKR